MKYCKKCGKEAKPNTWQEGYYCSNCGNLSFDDVKEYVSKFEHFTDNELYILKRQAIESSWEICACGSYNEFEIRLHEKLMNEIAEEVKGREI